MDRLTPEQRSENMRRIRGKNTRPEMIVRHVVFKMGYRYRLHYRILPGCPDLAVLGRKKAIFVHGCFWHGHDGCRLAHRPVSRTEFWLSKIERNRFRDEVNEQRLKALGWSVLTVWECETRSVQPLQAKLTQFLGR